MDAGSRVSRESGQTTVEYALATTFVIGVTVVAFGLLPTAVVSFFTGIVAQLTGLASGL